MHELKCIICQKKNVKWLLMLEVLAVIIYGLIIVASFSEQEWVFGENDMQLMRDTGIEDGNYLDTSFENAVAVVTPAFQIPAGVYYIEASFAQHGIVKAGLIYDTPRNGKELVDDDEFDLNQDKQAVSYRVRTHDDSKLRFKLRLTGDAVEGDYIQLFHMKIVSSKLTCAYRIFRLAAFLIFANLIGGGGYLKYYAKWDAEQKIVFLVLAFTAFFVSLPLFQSRLCNGADLRFHLSRLEGLYRGLCVGGETQFPVRVQPSWLNGYGYAVSVFYGDILMYVPALLRAVGFTLEESYKAYLGGVNIATVFLSFYAFKKMTKNDAAAMTGSVLYTGSMVRISMMYSAMVGGVSAMIFYPLIVAGFYLLFTEDMYSAEYKDTWMLLTVGFTGILMTHMLSCLMIGVYSVLLCIVMIKRVFQKGRFLMLLKASGTAVLLNLWYLIPFLQYMFTEKLRINSRMTQNKEIQDYYATLEDFTQEGKTLYQLFTDDNALGFALMLVLLFFIVTLPVQGKDRLLRRTKVFSLFALFSLIVCTNLFPVVALAKMSSLLMKMFRTIQYQYRLMSIAAVMLVCLAVLFLATDIFDQKKICYIAVALCSIVLYQNQQYFTTLSFDQVYLDAVELEAKSVGSLYSDGVGNGEYLPVITDTAKLTQEIESEEQIIVSQARRGSLSFDVNAENVSAESGKILFPILYYGGYQAIDDASHKKLETTIGDNGRVAVTVPPNYAGSFHLDYYEPLLWRIAELISVITLAVMVIAVYKPKGWKKWILAITEKGVADGN